MDIEAVKRKLKKKTKPKSIKSSELLRTGSTLLDLGCTGTIHGGFQKGMYVLLVGDSMSGKTWLSLTLLAEAAINPRFKRYRFIHDQPEYGAMMDIAHFFGPAVAKRLEPPKWDGDAPVYSESVEEFYDNLDVAFDAGKPFIYLLDSMDSLTSQAEEKKKGKQRTARAKGEDAKGSYGLSKPKYNSTHLNAVKVKLQKTGSILVIIAQTRDAIGQFAFGKTRSGGNSLRFYADMELWLSVAGRIGKTYKGKKRQQGIRCKCKIKKNRLTGRERELIVPIYHSLGIDDVGSCIDYLIDEKRWTKRPRGGLIKAPDLDMEATRPLLIRHIEKNDLEEKVRECVAATWLDIEEAVAVKRKRRYGR